MMRTPGSDPRDPREPYPSIGSALMLTLLAVLAAGFTGIAFIDFGLLAAVGIGQAIGVGAVATLGAQRVAEPQAQRLGLRGLDLEAIPMILCLIPAVLLASELDNVAAEWSGDPTSISETAARAREEAGALDASLEEGVAANDYDAIPADAYDIPSNGATTNAADDATNPVSNNRAGSERADDGDARLDADSETNAGPDELDEPPGQSDEADRLIDPDDPVSVLSAFIVMVGISPIVEEFLFRGVIQQGIVARLGLVRGISVVALLWTLLRPAPLAGFARFLAAAVASFALGCALGIVRIATRSILGPILLASGWAAVGLSAVVLEGRIALPGLNVPGSHLPVLVTLASAGLVGWAGWTIYQEAERRYAEDSIAQPRSPDGPTGGGGQGGGGGEDAERPDAHPGERTDDESDDGDGDGRPPLRLV